MSGAEPTVLFLCSGNYYRSRYAEHLFNELARAAGLSWRASSAGLEPACHTRNPGPISPHTRDALAKQGIQLEEPVRAPLDVTEALLRGATHIVAVKEREHLPLMRERFPEWAARVEYWAIDDLDAALPSTALPALEARVRALLERLGAEGRVTAVVDCSA